MGNKRWSRKVKCLVSTSFGGHERSVCLRRVICGRWGSPPSRWQRERHVSVTKSASPPSFPPFYIVFLFCCFISSWSSVPHPFFNLLLLNFPLSFAGSVCFRSLSLFTYLSKTSWIKFLFPQLMTYLSFYFDLLSSFFLHSFLFFSWNLFGKFCLISFLPSPFLSYFL